MKNIILIFLLFITTTIFGQTKYYFYFPRQENSAVITAKMENAKANIDNAYKAYNQGNLEKTKYYLDQSEDDGYVSAAFYYLLGKWCYDKDKIDAADRYWMRGYRKHGCWECKELRDSLIYYQEKLF